VESLGSGGGFDPKLTHVRTVQTNDFGRGTCSPLSYPDTTTPPQRDLPISWNIAPTQNVLAIRLIPETQQRTLHALKWGLIPYWAKNPKIAFQTINARTETVDTAPSFRQSFMKRRCLIPSDGFYEWKKLPDQRLSTGFGLERALPDTLCKSIIADQIAPRFAAGDFNGGLNAAIDKITGATRDAYSGSGKTVAEESPANRASTGQLRVARISWAP
jgi:hypothetical protein